MKTGEDWYESIKTVRMDFKTHFLEQNWLILKSFDLESAYTLLYFPS